MVGSNPAERALLPAAQNFGWLLRLQPGLFAWDVSRGQRGGIFSADPDADRREAAGFSAALPGRAAGLGAGGGELTPGVLEPTAPCPAARVHPPSTVPPVR